MRIDKIKTYLVTGGSGFLGKKLISRLTKISQNIVVLSRNEGNLIKLKQLFPAITIITGDVSDRCSVKQALKEVDGVFHLAAFKHVGMAQTLSRECVKSNIIGTLNILEEASAQNVDFILGISTDKAAKMTGVYGASKYIMEKLFAQFEKNYPDVNFRIVRYGNIFYSTGSVLCKWKKLLKQGKTVTVTDPSATRYFWTVQQAVDLIFECIETAIDCSPYVPYMKSISVGNLLDAMAIKYLPKDKQLDVTYIGLQSGENMHEKIAENGKASNEVEQYTIEEIGEFI